MPLIDLARKLNLIETTINGDRRRPRARRLDTRVYFFNDQRDYGFLAIDGNELVLEFYGSRGERRCVTSDRVSDIVGWIEAQG